MKNIKQRFEDTLGKGVNEKKKAKKREQKANEKEKAKTGSSKFDRDVETDKVKQAKDHKGK